MDHPDEAQMFTQPPPGATHRPNGEPAPVGDTLDVWPVASRQGATVTVRLPDIFPTFPYQWQGDDYWYGQVERMVREVQASGADNIYGYEIWNEPQWTWNASWGDYYEMWDRTYRLIRDVDPDAKIIGPSYDRDYVRGLREFMMHTVEAGTVPDIVSWHELGPEEGLEVEQHVEYWRSLEREFGVGPLPISINEYGSPRDSGVPGWLIRYIAKLERAEVDTANLAFWHKPGRLSDLLVPKGGGSGPATDPEPTGNYWLFDWYGDMSGQMVQVEPSASGRYTEVGEPTPIPATRQPGQPGFGNAIKLNGAEPNRYVEMPSGIVSELSDFTIAGWVNPSVISTWSRIFDFGTGQNTNMFLTPDAGGGMRFAITTSGGGGEQRINTTTILPTNTWSHVAVTKSGTTGTLWVNGEAVGTQPNLTLSPSALGETTRNWIGRSQYSDPLLDAAVDDFRIYDRGLTAGEIAGLADGPGDNSASDLVAAYDFNEADGNTVFDASGNGQHAMVSTGTTVERIPSLDGFASADDATDTVRVIFGGGEGDAQLQLDGLTALDDAFDGKAHVQVFKSEWTGTDGVSRGPVALFEGDYVVKDGSLSMPMDSLVETDAYLAVVTPKAEGQLRAADPSVRSRGERPCRWCTQPQLQNGECAAGLRERLRHAEACRWRAAPVHGRHATRWRLRSRRSLHQQGGAGRRRNRRQRTASGRLVRHDRVEPAVRHANCADSAQRGQECHRFRGSFGSDRGGLHRGHALPEAVRGRERPVERCHPIHCRPVLLLCCLLLQLGIPTRAQPTDQQLAPSGHGARGGNVPAGDRILHGRDRGRAASADPCWAHPANRRRAMAGRHLRPDAVPRHDSPDLRHGRAPGWYVDNHSRQG